MPGTYTSRATAKFWVMPRTGTALLPVDSTATGATTTKGIRSCSRSHRRVTGAG